MQDILGMIFLRKGNFSRQPDVSIILLDWSVRESFHTLTYLNRQRIDRSRYEIIWIEFYDRHAEEIDAMIKKSEALGLPSPVDTWIVLGALRSECYHKHRMYNTGILNSSGRIVVILDSDAIVKPTFIELVIKEFEQNGNLALHFEQIRNFDKRFYPFNYPIIDEINGEGCVNAVNGAPKGFQESAKSLKEDWNLWHIYNYGACLCARRGDLINIGGADEHIDYLGHVCGPYEMTARLINAGVHDKLHPTHFLYHVWHPNQGGDNNYCGPNNGRGMSTTAMEIPKTDRILPLVENEGIKILRSTTKRNSEGYNTRKLPPLEEEKRVVYEIQSYNEKGWLLYFENKYNEAIDIFDKALKMNPSSQSALRGKGWSYIQKGDYDNAVQFLIKAVDIIDPINKDQYSEAVRGLAQAHFHKGEYQKAIQFFNKAIESTDAKAVHVLCDIYSFIGWANIYLNQFDDAARAFKNSLDYIGANDSDLSKNITAGFNLATIGKKEGGLNGVYMSTWRTQVNSSTALSEFGLPEIIELEPTHTCNLRCIQCHTSYQNLGKGLIDPKFVKNLKGLEGKWFIIGSTFEPFAHPDICDILLNLSSLDMKMELATNGTLLTQKLTDRLGGCSFSNFTISFDGIKKETYESIRINANYEKGMERILYFKNAMRSKVSFFAINNTLMRRNLDEVLESVEFWEKEGFDHIGLIAMVIRDLNETLKNENLKPIMDSVYEKLYNIAQTVIERNYKITASSSIFAKPSEFKTRYPRNFIGSCVKSDNPAARIPFNPRTLFLNGEFPGMHVTCRYPFKMVRIMWNGDVEICNKFIIGNIYRKSLKDIWYGNQAEKYRKMILTSPKVCYVCDYYKFCIKGGEVDYSSEDNFYSEKVRKYNTPTLIESFRGYNIISWNDKCYGVPQKAGAVNLKEDFSKIKGIIIDKSYNSLREKIIKYPIATSNSIKKIIKITRQIFQR